MNVRSTHGTRHVPWAPERTEIAGGSDNLLSVCHGTGGIEQRPPAKPSLSIHARFPRTLWSLRDTDKLSVLPVATPFVPQGRATLESRRCNVCAGYAVRAAAFRAWLDKCDCYVRYVWRFTAAATARTDRNWRGQFEFRAAAVRSLLRGRRAWQSNRRRFCGPTRGLFDSNWGDGTREPTEYPGAGL